MTLEKKKAIRDKIKKGYPIGELKAELNKEGYTESEINDCIGIHNPNMKSWYFIFGILFCLFSIFLFITDKSTTGILITLSMGIWLLYLFNKEVNKTNRNNLK